GKGGGGVPPNVRRCRSPCSPAGRDLPRAFARTSWAPLRSLCAEEGAQLRVGGAAEP
ncbi:unnamed protein product, partial [Prorocentrum cordatum]